MEIWQGIVLGLVQGLTEFLPVSSSGHLAFFQRCFGLTDITLFFTIVLHLGTLVAVCTVFWRDIFNLFKKPFKTLGLLVLATVPAAVVGLLADELIEDAILNGAYFGIIVGLLFLVTAAMLFATQMLVLRRRRLAQSSDMAETGQRELPVCLKTAVPMGLAQAFAVLPGISRSGSTICAGTVAGGKSEDIAKFSFLMSIPVILGSFVVELYKGLKSGQISQSFSTGGATFGWSIALGFIVSAVAGLFAIKVMMQAIRKANYKWFSLYLVLLAVTCFILQFTYFNV